MRSWANSLFALCLLIAAPAAATPPQIVNVHDTLFARNADTLLILREVSDNHGQHSTLQTDTLLIYRSLTDGADRGFRGVERVVEQRESATRVQYFPLAAPANPYAVRADGFWPLRMPVRPDETARLDSSGLALGDAFFLPADQLMAHIEDTLQATRGILPIHFIEGDTDPFDPAAFQATECAPGPAMELRESESDPALVHITCEDAETGQRAALWIVVPDA